MTKKLAIWKRRPINEGGPMVGSIDPGVVVDVLVNDDPSVRQFMFPAKPEVGDCFADSDAFSISAKPLPAKLADLPLDDSGIHLIG